MKPLLSKHKVEDQKASLMLEELCRKGDFDKPKDQARDLPILVLEDIKAAVCAALLQTLDGSLSQQNFSDICQGTDETFIKFIDSLKDVLEKEINNPGRSCSEIWQW